MTARLFARGLLVLGSAKVAFRLGSLGWTICLARYLGVSAYGEYTVLMAVAATVALLGNSGVGVILGRDLARQPHERERSLFFSAWLVHTAVLTLAAIVMLAGAWLLRRSAPTMPLLLLAAYLPANGTYDLLAHALRARQQFVKDGALNLLNVAVFVGASVLLLRLGAGMTGIFLAFLIKEFVCILGAVLMQRDFALFFRPVFNSTTLRYLGKESAPLFVSTTLSSGYARSDVFIIGALLASPAVGIYGAAYRVAQAPVMVLDTFALVGLPLLAKRSRAGAQKAAVDTLRLGALAVALTGLGGAVAALAAPTIVQTVYGGQFAGAVAPLRLLFLGTAVFALARIGETHLIVSGRQRYLLVSHALTGLVMISSIAVLVSLKGISGAAAGVALGYATLAVLTTAPAVVGALGRPQWWYRGRSRPEERLAPNRLVGSWSDDAGPLLGG